MALEDIGFESESTTCLAVVRVGWRSRMRVALGLMCAIGFRPMP